jgi:hypothetical protein
MINFIKELPSYILLLILTVIYVGCGFVIGYYYGYTDGQTDYVKHLNQLTNQDNQKSLSP